MKIVSIIALNDERTEQVVTLAKKVLRAGADNVYVIIHEKKNVYKAIKNLKNVFSHHVKTNASFAEQINQSINAAISIGQHKISSCKKLSVFVAGLDYSPEVIAAIINGDEQSNVWTVPVISDGKVQNRTFVSTRHDRIVLREQLGALNKLPQVTGGVSIACFGMSQRALYQLRVKFESDLDPNEHLTETLIENKVGPIHIISNCFVSVS